jgi:amidophosphoribosyltransferase
MMESGEALRDASTPDEDDHPHEACGVFGIYAPGHDVARLTFFGLYALQHRGQESAGIATSDAHSAYIHKGMGLVSHVFTEETLRPLKGHLAIGHNRYSTTGSSHFRNAQPYLIETIYGPLGVAHNGNLTNALELRYKLLERGVGLSSSTDSEVITQMLAAPPAVWTNGNGHAPANDVPATAWEARIEAFMSMAEGAYSLTIMTADAVYGVRDPLCLGQLDGGHVIASESAALATIGARFVREIEPGEIVRLDRDGVTSRRTTPAKRRALCSFEYVYFARPDSRMDGQTVHDARQRMGRELAREAPADADIVVPVPDSSTPAAIGYSLESGLPFTEGLIKNRYIGRTFIQPNDQLRKVGIQLKFNPLEANLRGRRVVLIDDSIVRGNTVGPLIQLVRDAGAKEVHVRVSSPPVRHPCFMGVDMATYRQLIANQLDIDQIRDHIKADSLAYLSLPGMLKAIGPTDDDAHGHCAACFSGQYPIPVPQWLFEEDRDKRIFETTWGG